MPAIKIAELASLLGANFEGNGNLMVERPVNPDCEDVTQDTLFEDQLVPLADVPVYLASTATSDPNFEDLDPCEPEDWTDKRRLRVSFFQTVLTQKAFAEATPYGGVRILGALVDDAPGQCCGRATSASLQPCANKYRNRSI